METRTLAEIGLLILAIGLIPFFFHVRAYLRLLNSIKTRGLDVKYLAPKRFGPGAGGFIGKIKIIEEKYLVRGDLSKEEEKLLFLSKRSYYVIAPFLLGYMVTLILMLLRVK